MTREEALNILHNSSVYHPMYLDALDMAIKALEQQPSGDCISREAVDEYITNLLSGYLYDEERARLEDLSAYIWELPSVTPKAEQKWIPVSKRLPESDEEYHTFLVTDSKGKVTLSEFYLSLDRKPYWSGMIDVIAWMPLPQHYKAESEEENG